MREIALLINVKKKTSKFANCWKRQREERRHVRYLFGEWGGRFLGYVPGFVPTSSKSRFKRNKQASQEADLHNKEAGRGFPR